MFETNKPITTKYRSKAKVIAMRNGDGFSDNEMSTENKKTPFKDKAINYNVF